MKGSAERAAFGALRVAITLFWLLTAAYGVVCYSPFAFEMFIRPQLMPWVGRFVVWHHVWYLAAYAATVVTLIRDIDPRSRASGRRATAVRWLARAYVLLFGGIGVWLVVSPYLPLLWNDERSYIVALASFVPLAWLAAIDHLASPSPIGALRDQPGSDRLFLSCALTAAYLWLVHFGRALAYANDGTAGVWALTGIWTLAVVGTAFMIIFALLALAASLAACTRRPCLVEYALTVALIAVSIGEFLRRAILPTIALDAVSAAQFAAVAGSALALGWSGLALRVTSSYPRAYAAHRLLPAIAHRPIAVALLLALSLTASSAIEVVGAVDWFFVGQRTLIVGECLLVLGLVSSLTAGALRRPAWQRLMPVVALATFAALFMIPRAALAVAEKTGRHEWHPALSLQRYAAAEPMFAFMAGAIVEGPGHDSEYYRFLQSVSAHQRPVVLPDAPPVSVQDRANESAPDIFMFVIDSLRSDYLSPYNPSVDFTPSIGRFADDSFVFLNAFTRHGGTELAMSSIWAGRLVSHRVRVPGFERMNALEKLLTAHRYRIAINDFTIRQLLTSDVTNIDEGVPSVETDLCQNLESLKRHLDASPNDKRAVFGYFAPMNVHILNTRGADPTPATDDGYEGFYVPYASRLRRIDGCFGTFVSYLKAHDRYDNAIIIVTSDHGDSLGEDGYWGHHWLFPEDIRVPLIIHVPEKYKAQFTMDLAQVAFSADITPTLYTLLGHPAHNEGELFGAPLFVARDKVLPSRRRSSFLLTSSYSPTYGLLRRNGSSLYVSDLFEKREFAFDLRGPRGRAHMPVEPGFRQLNHRLIREQLAGVARTFPAVPH